MSQWEQLGLSVVDAFGCLRSLRARERRVCPELGLNSLLPNTLAVLRTVPILADKLRRGFMSVRDTGADYASRRRSMMALQGPLPPNARAMNGPRQTL